MAKEKEIALSPIVGKAEKLAINNDADLGKATEMLSQMNQELDALTVDKEKLTKPLNATLKEIRERYKPAESRLEAGISIIRKLMSGYQTQKKEAIRLEEEKIAARVKPGKGNLSHETAIEKMDSLEKPLAIVESESGSVKFRTVRKFEIVDKTKVPFEYLEINETAIRTALKAGIEVPGIRYFDEEVPINSR